MSADGFRPEFDRYLEASEDLEVAMREAEARPVMAWCIETFSAASQPPTWHVIPGGRDGDDRTAASLWVDCDGGGYVLGADECRREEREPTCRYCLDPTLRRPAWAPSPDSGWEAVDGTGWEMGRDGEWKPSTVYVISNDHPNAPQPPHSEGRR